MIQDFDIKIIEKITKKDSTILVGGASGVEMERDIYNEIKDKYGRISDAEVISIYRNEYSNR